MKQYFLLIILTVLLFASFQFESKPTYQLAFANFGPVDTDIFIADSDGNNAKPLFVNHALDYNASFSADGAWIVFTSDRNGSADIYRARVDGTALEQLTNDTAFDDQAVFSPDGKKIAFVSTRNGQADIYTLDIATKKIMNITNHPSGDFRPAWSPDGQWIAFSTDRDSKKRRIGFTIVHSTEIYTMRSDGSDLMRRTNTDAFAGSPCWSPDGKQLVFYEATLDQVFNRTFPITRKDTTQLSILNLSDNTKQVLLKDSTGKNCPKWLADGRIGYKTSGENGGIQFTKGHAGAKGEFGNPFWSPNGSKLLFHREVNLQRPPFKKLYSRDKQFQLIRTGIFPSFSSDGTQLICNDKSAGILHNKIMQMAIDGTHRFILFGDSVKSVLAPMFSPKGDKIAFGYGSFFQNLLGASIADIAIIDKDGSHLKILTDGKGNYGFPSWSPDGKRIVYRGSTNNVKGLFIVDVETGAVTNLTTNSHDNFPTWSPNGERIAFTSFKDGNYDIYSIKLDGSDLKRLTTDPGNDAHSIWSPDGQWIAYASGMGGFKDEAALHPVNPQPQGEICVMRADGSDKRMLTDNQYEEATPAWMPLKK